MVCEEQVWFFCLAEATGNAQSSFFGFGEYITSVALLVIVFTITDLRHRFRVLVAPGNLYRQAFIVIGTVGIFVLLKDLWIAEKWIVVYIPGLTQAVFESILGVAIFVIAMKWIYYSFIQPPVFSRKNAERFARTLYQIVLKGSEAELPVIADELARSSKEIVKQGRSKPIREQKHNADEESVSVDGRKPEDYVDDVLWIMADKKLCRHIVASSPATAIIVFSEISKTKKYWLPAGVFAHNIVEEAIRNPNSRLYHDTDHYSGLVGHVRSFTHALFGNWLLVDRLEPSPLNVNFEFVSSWSAEQLSAYIRCIEIAIESYLTNKYWGVQAFSIFNAFDLLKQSVSETYRISVYDPDYYKLDQLKKLKQVVKFINSIIKTVDKLDPVPSPAALRRSEHPTGKEDLYDYLADLMLDVIENAQSVKGSGFSVWDIQHNIVWLGFFREFTNSQARKFILFKVRRKIYEEIKQMDDFPNYRGAKLIGYCLNVMGFKINEKSGVNRHYLALARVLIPWVKRYYLELREKLPHVADACLIGTISFDEENNRLVKTYIRGLRKEIPKDFLELDRPENPLLTNQSKREH